jgi:excisionase family DNA binding protein
MVSCSWGCRFCIVGSVPKKERKLLTIPEAAQIVGVTRAVLWRHVKQDHLKAEQAGRFYLIEEEEAMRFRDERARPGRPKTKPAR